MSRVGSRLGSRVGSRLGSRLGSIFRLGSRAGSDRITPNFFNLDPSYKLFEEKVIPQIHLIKNSVIINPKFINLIKELTMQDWYKEIHKVLDYIDETEKFRIADENKINREKLARNYFTVTLFKKFLHRIEEACTKIIELIQFLYKVLTNIVVDVSEITDTIIAELLQKKNILLKNLYYSLKITMKGSALDNYFDIIKIGDLIDPSVKSSIDDLSSKSTPKLQTVGGKYKLFTKHRRPKNSLYYNKKHSFTYNKKNRRN
jgi:hypothetical protein